MEAYHPSIWSDLPFSIPTLSGTSPPVLRTDRASRICLYRRKPAFAGRLPEDPLSSRSNDPSMRFPNGEPVERCLSACNDFIV